MQVDKLEEAGVKKMVCLAVAKPEEVSEWAKKVGLTGSKIEVWADTKGAWTRMLGLDENQFDAPGPRSQRYKVPGLQYLHETSNMHAGPLLHTRRPGGSCLLNWLSARCLHVVHLQRAGIVLTLRQT